MYTSQQVISNYGDKIWRNPSIYRSGASVIRVIANFPLISEARRGAGYARPNGDWNPSIVPYSIKSDFTSKESVYLKGYASRNKVYYARYSHTFFLQVPYENISFDVGLGVLFR